MAENINIGGRLHSTATGNVVAGANEILDDTKGKKQSVVNQETDAALADRYTKEETYSKQELNGMVSPQHDYVVVETYADLADITDHSNGCVYRVSNYDGTNSQVDATMYSEYAWDGTQYVHLATKSQIGEVFDVSEYNATGGTLATYASLDALLSDANLGTIIPVGVRKGGMSIKFVQSSDNKYVQYRLMADTFNTDVANWQGVDDKPTVGSNNLVKSGGVQKIFDEIDFNIGEKSSIIEMTDSRYIACGGNIGDTISLTPTENELFRYAVINCQETDVFYVQGIGGIFPRLYCFIDESNKIIENAAANTEADTPLKLIAPANSSKLIINDRKSGRNSYMGELQRYCVNVNTLNNIPQFSNANPARNRVPKYLRSKGLIITYKLSDGWHLEQYIGEDIAGWLTQSNWDSKDSYFINANEYLNHPNSFSSVSTMRNLFPTRIRKSGIIVTYLAVDGWHLEQFISFDVSNWGNSQYWINLKTTDANLCKQLDLISYQSNNHAYINPSGVWGAYENARYALIPVSDLSDYVSIQGVAKSLCVWLKTDYTTSGALAKKSDIDGNLYKFTDGEIKNIKKPSDANYLYITLISGGENNLAPKSVNLGGWYLSQIENLSTYILPNVSEPIDLDTYENTGHLISSDNVWVNATNAAYALIPANVLSNTIYVKANAATAMVYAWLTQGYSGSSVVSFAPSDNIRHTISKDTIQYMSKPSDANYLYILMVSSTSVNYEPEYVGEDVGNDYGRQIFDISKRLDAIEPKSAEDGDMNLNIVSYDKHDTANSYWYIPSVISTIGDYKKIYSTFVDSEGYAGVISVDAFCHSIIKNKLKRKLTDNHADTHNCCAVEVLPNKKLIVSYSDGHADTKYMNIRISKKPEDITEFEDVIRVNMGGPSTYSQYIYKNGKHYIFARIGLSKWKFIVSEDLETWSGPYPFITTYGPQYYIILREVTDEPLMMRFSMYSNPAYEDTNIRIGYIDFENNKILNSDHETILGTFGTDEILNTNFTILVPAPAAGIKQRMFDLAITALNDVKVLYGRVSNATDGEYFINENGVDIKICDAGYILIQGVSYVNLGVAFINQSKLIVCYGADGADNVAIWNKENNSWVKWKNIYSEVREPSSGVFIRNGYPIVDVHGRYATWIRGNIDLNSYYDAKMEQLIYDVDKDTIF